MDDYREFASSFITGAVEFIYGDAVDQIIQEGDHFDPYFTTASGNGEDRDHNEAMLTLYEYWWDIQQHFSFTKYLNKAIRNCYMVVPAQGDLFYIWDAEFYDEKQYDPFEHRDYYPHEEENLKKIMTGEAEDTLAYYRRDGLICTVMRGIHGSDNKVIAVAAMDISLDEMLASFWNLMINLAVVLFFIMAGACVIYYLILNRSIIEPLLSMEQKTKGLVDRLKSGSEEPLQMDVHTGDEIESLANVLEDMGESLVTYIRESEKAAVEKDRVATEMKLAGSIQANMLPDLAVCLQDQKEIELSASMTPADAVGGDFYDCFSVDEDHIAFVIADVSGDGVPAALFMALTMTLIRSYASDNIDPASILTKVNKQICGSNKDKMFVTVWMGILSPATGILKACNAGHEYPILKTSDGSYNLLNDQHSFLIGIKEDIPFTEYELQLQKDSILFVYTDGVTEAMNPLNQPFGTDRMLDTLNFAAPQTPGMVLDVIKAAVCDFTKDNVQKDDITMMCLRYLGN
jgi:sigma-B regulation protein RsbU (phosphoserine phosphatase)